MPLDKRTLIVAVTPTRLARIVATSDTPRVARLVCHFEAGDTSVLRQAAILSTITATTAYSVPVAHHRASITTVVVSREVNAATTPMTIKAHCASRSIMFPAAPRRRPNGVRALMFGFYLRDNTRVLPSCYPRDTIMNREARARKTESPTNLDQVAMAIMMRAATQHSRTNSPTWSVTLGAAIPTEPTHRATTTYPWAKSRRRPGPLQVDIVMSE